MLYTLFAFTRSSMLEICTVEAQSLDDAARSIDCRVESRGHDRLPLYRPHLIGASQCATLTTSALTKEGLLRLATAEKNQRALALLRNQDFRPIRLHIGNVPRAASHYAGNDRLAANRDRASEARGTYVGDEADGPAPRGVRASDFREFGVMPNFHRGGKTRHRGGGRANNGRRKGQKSTR